MRLNSYSVELTFSKRFEAERFYFNAPGEGYAFGLRVYKCVEGERDAAIDLCRMAKRYVRRKKATRRSHSAYAVEVE